MRFLLIFFTLLFASFSAYSEDANSLSLSTTGFPDQGALPVLYTCDGKDISPAFAWTNPPANTQSFVMVLSDPDAPGGTWYHWIVYNIPGQTKELSQGIQSLPQGAKLGKNSWEKMAYNGPCPPKGSAHTYFFTLYALDTQLNLKEANGTNVLDAMKNHILKQAQLSTTYSRWLK